jgi:hypothetical protein
MSAAAAPANSAAESIAKPVDFDRLKAQLRLLLAAAN